MRSPMCWSQNNPVPELIQPKGYLMSTTELHAEHTIAEHQHGENCGHETVPHGDHVDYLHDGHKHAAHGDHYDEH